MLFCLQQIENHKKRSFWPKNLKLRFFRANRPPEDPKVKIKENFCVILFFLEKLKRNALFLISQVKK